MPDCAEKIKVIRKMTKAENSHSNLIIQVDGGINAETARICTSFGANSLVAGNYIYKSENIIDAIKSLKL
jgi:ribulose-phosphate 3-epimerase